MKTIKRITVICFVVIVLAANLPLCASATDPVSAATMANALAQAITAYGASQGVSMTFDVTSTDGIGEGVHELWDNFKEDIQDNNVPTYDSLAVTMWADIYTKVGNKIGININDTEMPYIDAFWNWLLSGPAEMTKVDNEYFEWTLNQNNTVDPIIIYNSSDFGNQPLPYFDSSASAQTKFNSAISFRLVDTGYNQRLYSVLPYDCYAFQYPSGNTMYFVIAWVGDTSIRTYFPIVQQYLNEGQWYGNISTTNAFEQNSQRNGSSGIYQYIQSYSSIGNDSYFLPQFTSLQDGLNYLTGVNNGTIDTDELTLMPYIGDTTPQNVYIPDNDDVNYAPIPYVGGLDIPWDDSLFGDGTGTLTDAQSESISGVIDDAITDSLEKTLTLADTENPDISAPNEVYIPLLPVELPSFNFSLSGIWHYVVSWVQSLGAWLSLMFQTWAVLPSAITIPVYATAVIVIVLGVYKRFFM